MAAELGVDKIFGRGTTPRDVASYLVHALTPGPAAAGRRGMTAACLREGLSVTHRRYVPASHAHYGGNLVDGAYVLGLFGDVATELASAPTATSPSSPPTPRSSSWPRCWPETS